MFDEASEALDERSASDSVVEADEVRECSGLAESGDSGVDGGLSVSFELYASVNGWL